MRKKRQNHAGSSHGGWETRFGTYPRETQEIGVSARAAFNWWRSAEAKLLDGDLGNLCRIANARSVDLDHFLRHDFGDRLRQLYYWRTRGPRTAIKQGPEFWHPQPTVGDRLIEAGSNQ